MSTTDIAARPGTALGEAAYRQYDDEKIALIRSTLLPPEASNADLYMLLELSARYGLDPFTREIWIAKMRGKQGEKGGVAILVGRDGLLKVAERHPEYQGNRCQAVYSNDEYRYLAEPRAMPDGTYSHVSHSWTLKDRGELLGAYCEVYRKERPPTFFWAPLDEYKPAGPKLEKTPWRNQVTAMIQKCALSNALRVAFRISGLYDEAEMTNALDYGEQERAGGPAPLDYGDDPVLAEWLVELFQAANALREGSFLPAKQRAMLAGAPTVDDREALAAELVAFIEKYEGEVPARPQPRAAEPIEDAEYEVVDVTAEAVEAAPDDDLEVDPQAKAKWESQPDPEGDTLPL